MTKSKAFISPSQGKLSLHQVVDSIAGYLYDDPQSFYRLVIGSDSQERRINGEKIINYVSAVVVHRVGKGGRYFWQNGKKEKIRSLRQKIYTETLLSLEVAEKIVPLIRKKLNGKRNWELEIHIDVGQAGETRDMIKEVVGMVTGNGYTAKTKPDSYGACTIADKHA
jgi:predicted RNase H-related nuclease YkuK (DUF458 family)